MGRYPWNDTVDKPFIMDLLKRGFSRAQIVAEMPVRDGIRLTRNAMIGKISRWEMNGLKPRKPADPSKRPHRAKTTKAPSAPKTIEAPAPKPKAAPVPPPPILFVKPKEEPGLKTGGDDFQLSAGGKAVLSLQFHECKWPVGDPRASDFHFCCAPRVEDQPYCQHHLFERAAEPNTRVGWWKPKSRR